MLECGIMQKLSILIPVYNEKATIISVLDQVINAKTLGLEKELIIVDDYSTDGTREILQGLNTAKYNAKVVFHEKNMGKGACMRSAQENVAGDIIIIQDADLEYDPGQYMNLLQPVIQGQADVVYGSRISGGTIRRAFNFKHLLANKFLSFLTNLLYDSSITDMETGYKVFRAEHFKRIKIRSNRFDFEPEITAKVSKQNMRLSELPISYFGRDYSGGKKITWHDGIIAIWALFWYRFFD